MLPRARTLGLALALGACVVQPVRAAADGPSVERAAGLGDPAPTLAREERPRRLTTVDHSETPCFLGTEAPLFTRAPLRRGGLVTTIRASVRIDRDPIEVAPGATLRLEVAVENVRPRPIVLSADTITRLGALAVRGVIAEWSAPVRSPSALAAGTALAPRRVLRLCARLEVPPIDAVPAGARAYAIEWPTLPSAGAPPHLDIVVRHPACPRTTIAREPESWRGVIRVRLAPGASIARIARETGLRVDRGARLAGRADRDHVFVEAPPDRRVLDTALALSARADVLSASPVLVGDPETGARPRATLRR